MIFVLKSYPLTGQIDIGTLFWKVMSPYDAFRFNYI